MQFLNGEPHEPRLKAITNLNDEYFEFDHLPAVCSQFLNSESFNTSKYTMALVAQFDAFVHSDIVISQVSDSSHNTRFIQSSISSFEQMHINQSAFFHTSYSMHPNFVVTFISIARTFSLSYRNYIFV